MLRMLKNFRSQFAMLLLLTVCSVQLMASGGVAETNGRYVTVTLDGRHRIRGQTEQTIYENQTFVAFKGVPFAEAPVGRLRFKPPVAKTLPRSLDALAYGNLCTQLINNQFLFGAEDCLFLNVFTPAIVPNRNLAVMVLIPGGGFTAGGADDNFSGPDFLIEKDVVVVSINYRLNALGFMSLGSDEYSGNMGLKDQQLALRWIQRHIRQFGGDPQRVTVIGGSAGGGSVHLQMLAASSKGLFQRAILMSGSAGNYWSVSSQVDHRQRMMDLAQKHNPSVNSLARLMDWLQRAPAMHLFDLDDSNPIAEIIDPNYEFAWAPVASNGSAEQTLVIKNDLHQVLNYESDLDVLFGYNSDEMVGFLGHWYGDTARFLRLDDHFDVSLPFKSWRECRNATAYSEVMSAIRHFYFGDARIDINTFNQLIRMLSDMQVNYGIDQSVQHQIAHSTGETYFYRISANTTLNILKRLTNTVPLLLASHGDETCYIFKCSLFPNIYEHLLPESTERIVQNNLLNLWTNFAKFGNPTPQGVPLDFAPVTVNHHHLVDIGNYGLTPIVNPNQEANDFWDALYEKHSADFELP